MRVELIGYVRHNGGLYGPGEIIKVGEADARHLEKSGAGRILPEPEEPEEVVNDGGPGGSEPILQPAAEQPSVGERKPDRQRKGTVNRRKAT
ncbi:hypothetical protein [Moorella stamsii]|uniref:DUF7210 family protein n=1 Tax=Neomoorella stamsii TaxID=1266720 RepID=UPI00101AE074|nr:MULTISPECIES: hypothetical protein [Moorella]